MSTGSAMRKPRIQPGRGSAHADSMIDGRTMLTGHGALGVGQRLLAERLRERVGVGPADAGGAGPSGLDEAVAHPALAELLGLGGERGRAGGAELGAGGGAELDELDRLAAGRLGVAAQPAGRGDLGLPAQPEVERPGADELLGGVAASVAGDVARRHRHDVRA